MSRCGSRAGSLAERRPPGSATRRRSDAGHPYDPAVVAGQVRSVGRDVATVSAAEALIALAVLLALSAWAARRVVRARGTPEPSWLAWFGGFASLALVVAVTLFRSGLPSGVDLGGIGEWSAAGLRLLTRDPLGSSQFLLNVALFVPAGMLWAWLVRRPLLVVAVLMVGSLLVESLQGLTGAGAPDVADLVANGLGAAIGAASATAARFIAAPGSPRMTSRRRRAIGMAAGLATLAIVAIGLFGASQRQQSVEDALRAEFAGTDRSNIEARLATDPNAVFGAAPEFADGTYTSETSLEIRYPADFFGLQRCVYVIWTTSGVEFHKATGHACTRPTDEAATGG